MAEIHNYPSVEFRNNGIIDQLTGAPSQSAFLKSLKQAIGNSRRNKSELSIITIKQGDKSLNTSAKFESSLISLSKGIRKNLRSEDTYTRMSKRGYWILIHGNKTGCDKLLERMNISATNGIDIQVHPWVEDLKLVDWIQKVDSAYFTQRRL